MSIGKRIRLYREKAGITQTALALRLNVSPQAVSKWENDIALPDITLIPPLADFFRISCDALLLEETSAEADISRILMESQVPELRNPEERASVLRLLENAVQRYPRSCPLLLRLAEIYSQTGHGEKAIPYLERAALLTDSPAERHTAVQLLCYLYGSSAPEKVLDLAASMPEIYQTRLALAYHAFTGQEQAEQIREYFHSLLDTAESIFTLSENYSQAKPHFSLLRQIYDRKP